MEEEFNYHSWVLVFAFYSLLETFSQVVIGINSVILERVDDKMKSWDGGQVRKEVC